MWVASDSVIGKRKKEGKNHEKELHLFNAKKRRRNPNIGYNSCNRRSAVFRNGAVPRILRAVGTNRLGGMSNGKNQ